MTQRDALLVFGSVVLAAAIAGLLLVGALATQPGERPGEGRPRSFYFGERPPPGRGIEFAQERVPPAFRTFVPIQRDVARTFREGAGYLLLLLGVSGTLVLAREQVVAGYRASLGGWRAQARVLAVGAALLALLVSAAFLAFVVLLGGLAVPSPGRFPLQSSLQIGLTAMAVVLVFVGAAVLVGFSAAAWRLGDALLSLRPLARLASRVPAPLVALLGATIVFLLAQIPVVGTVVVLGAIAYALGSVTGARFAHGPSASTVT